MEEYIYNDVTPEDEAVLAAEESADQETFMGLDDDLGATEMTAADTELPEEPVDPDADDEMGSARDVTSETGDTTESVDAETAAGSVAEADADAAGPDAEAAREDAVPCADADGDGVAVPDEENAAPCADAAGDDAAVPDEENAAPCADAAGDDAAAASEENVASAADADGDDNAAADGSHAEAQEGAATGEEDPKSPEDVPAERRAENAGTSNTSGGKKRPQTVTVVGVRFRTAGKAYYFSPGQFAVRHGMHVIVETARGIEYGTVVSLPMEIDRRRIKPPLREIIRPATREDDAAHAENRRKEREAYRVCFDKIREHRLEMKLIDAECTFDYTKILFYFTAEERVDFRDLVKDLAGIFKTRIELRQIGVRDETRILGGYGSCGRPLCCHTYLSDFVPVSIKMAKEQNLSLNPTKISGVCGRLMCCLKNEAETYEELNKNLPRQGDEVETPDGLQGEVESVNVLRQKVRILVEIDDEKEIHECNADELTIIRRRKRGEAKRRAKRIESGQERADELKPAERKSRLVHSAGGERPARENGAEDAERSGSQGETPAERKEHRRPDRRQGGRGSREDRQNAARERSERENGGAERGGRNAQNGQGGQNRRGGRDRNAAGNARNNRTDNNGERGNRGTEDRQNAGQGGNRRKRGKGRYERRDGQPAGGQSTGDSKGNNAATGGEN